MKQILVIGSMNLDYVLDVDHMPVMGETILSHGLTLVPGGKGANQAYAAAKLGGSVTMLGAVGGDSDGDRLCENLRQVGVDVSRIRRCPGVSTGLAMICVDQTGDNGIVVAQGANLRADRDYLAENTDLIAQSDLVVLQLEIPLDAVLFAAREARRLGKTVILDPAPAVSSLPEELYRCVDVIKPNEIELETLLGEEGSQGSLRLSCETLQKRGAKNVLVTLGGDGAYLLQEDGTERRFFPYYAGPVVDTTAAGDCFTAALALGLSRGQDLEHAAELAIRAAGIVVTRKGAQPSIPGPEEL